MLWLKTDSGALVNLDRVACLQIHGGAHPAQFVLMASGDDGAVDVVRGTEAACRDRLAALETQLREWAAHTSRGVLVGVLD